MDRTPKKRERSRNRNSSDIDQISDVHSPQCEVIDENLAAEIQTHEALNSSVLRDTVDTKLHSDGGETKQKQELSDIDQISDVHSPQSEAVDENLAAEIHTHEALNSSVLEPRIPTRLTAVLCAHVCASLLICERALQSRCEALHPTSHACAEGAPCCTG